MMKSKSNTTMINGGYSIVRSRPLAKFRYKGTHSKPVRRTVILTDVGRNVLTGYEVREGNEVRPLAKKVIKSFRREDISDLERFAFTTNCSAGW